MTTKTLSKSDLAQFTGSENWYRHGINRNVLYTDGVQHVAERGGAFWLLDEIAIIQPYNKAVSTSPAAGPRHKSNQQVEHLGSNPSHGHAAHCRSSGGPSTSAQCPKTSVWSGFQMQVI